MTLWRLLMQWAFAKTALSWSQTSTITFFSLGQAAAILA
jgi:hypothetical protein